MAIGKVTTAEKHKTYTNNNVSGTFVIDWAKYTTWDIIITAPTVLEQINMPKQGFTKTITLNVFGDEAFTPVADWGAPASGEFNGTVDTQIVVQCIDSSTNRYRHVYNN